MKTNIGRVSVFSATAIATAALVLSPMPALAATGADCNVGANLVGNVITFTGTVGFPAEADQAVIGVDLDPASGPVVSVDPLFDGPVTGLFEFQPFDVIGGVALPALPATVVVNWEYFVNYGTEDEQSFSGSCPAVSVTDANPVDPTDPPVKPAPPAAETGDVNFVPNGGLIGGAVLAAFIGGFFGIRRAIQAR
jgi:hypothetical protein